MKKVLTLSREEARLLYNLLSSHELPNRSDNRKRFKFLEVFEDFVYEFEDQLSEVKGVGKEFTKKATEVSKEEKGFTFNDREVFSKGKDIFEKSFDVGNASRDKQGQINRTPLIGRDAKIYVQLEDRFADVVDIKEEEKVK